MSSKKVTIDLTWPIITWLLIWSSAALVFKSTALVWVAFAPLAIYVCFTVGMLGLLMLFAGLAWVLGRPITITDSEGDTIKTIRRKR